MTEFDKRLLEKADTFRRWEWQSVDTLIKIADTAEAREQLACIRRQLRDLVRETV